MNPYGPPEATIARVRLLRGLTLWGLRTLGLALLVRGAYLCVNRVLFGLLLGDATLGWNAYTGVGEEHMAAAGLAAVLIGLALMLAARPLSRLVIAMPDPGCPACGHTGDVDADGRCVECGCRLVDARDADDNDLATTRSSPASDVPR